MRAQLIRVKHGDPWYFTTYYYKCIDCGAEYTRHQHNDRINPYCRACQRKHDTEAQRQRNINHKNKLIIDELEKIKAEIQAEQITDGQVYNGEYFSDDALNINYGISICLDILNKYISELKGE